jgi:hypothetical protein
MKKTLFLCTALLLCTLHLSGQFLFNQSFTAYETVACPYDSTVTITRPTGWLIYQTQDGRWDGPVDSSRCINGTNSFGDCVVLLNQIDVTKPLFIRYDLARFPHNYTFVPNTVYNAVMCSEMSPFNVEWKSGANCVQDLCSGLFIGLAIPDTNGVPGAAIRQQTGIADASAGGPAFCNGTNTCFPTEYFTDQTLAYYVAKFTFPDTIDTDGVLLYLSGTFIEQSYYTENFTEISALPFQFVNSAYSVPISSVVQGFATSYLALYTANTYPSAANPSYIEATPVPNANQAETINLVVDPFETLDIQPFTYFRGGLVAGSDSIRHAFNLLNNGGDICVNFIDLVVGGGTEYQHRSGQINMNNAFSCMQFRDGSALRMLDEGVLHYGNQGSGMLALCAGSRVVLSPGSTLLVDAVMNIAECDDTRPPEPFIDVELHPGSTLRFTENALLTNRFSQGQAMKLRLWMLGGSVDDGALSAEERALLIRAYPQPSPQLSDNLQLLGNDGNGTNLQIRYLSNGNEQLYIRWFDAQGKLQREQQATTIKGYQDIPLNPPAASGVYFIHVNDGRQTHVFVSLLVG